MALSGVIIHSISLIMYEFKSELVTLERAGFHHKEPMILKAGIMPKA